MKKDHQEIISELINLANDGRILEVTMFQETYQVNVGGHLENRRTPEYEITFKIKR